MSFISYARSPNGGPGVFLAVAAYDGLSAPFVQSLFSSRLKDYRLDLEIFAGNCHVDDGRNRLVRDFLETDCEQLVFLDTDVFWNENDLKKLIDYQADIVAGIYPYRSEEEEFPVKPLPGERWAVGGLVEVEGVPTGFLKIRRRVLETLYHTVSKHRSRDDGYGRKLIPVIFERTLNGLSRRGGDYEFCRKAREAGFKIYVDPLMQLGHQGTKLWTGCVGHHWRKDIALSEGLKAIRDGTTDANVFLELYNVWNNNWALVPEALLACTLLARNAKGPILDCGSGLSSLCMAAATERPVIALEQSPDWAFKIRRLAGEHGLTNLTVHESAVDGWYIDCPQHDYAVVVIDGPAGDDKRSGAFQNPWIHAAVVVVDDVKRAYSRKSVEDYCAETGRQFHVIEASKDFAIIP